MQYQWQLKKIISFLVVFYLFGFSSHGFASDIDTDNDGVLDTLDIDAYGDGLIEIQTLAELNNIRHNLTGSAYNDGSQVTLTLPEVSADAMVEIAVTVSDGNLSQTATASFTVKSRVQVSEPQADAGSGGGASFWLLLIIGLVIIYRTSRCQCLAKS